MSTCRKGPELAPSKCGQLSEDTRLCKGIPATTRPAGREQTLHRARAGFSKARGARLLAEVEALLWVMLLHLNFASCHGHPLLSGQPGSQKPGARFAASCPTPHPMDMPFSSFPQVQRFDKYSRNAALGEVRVALRELKASRSLAVCAELQKTTKVIND